MRGYIALPAISRIEMILTINAYTFSVPGSCEVRRLGRVAPRAGRSLRL